MNIYIISLLDAMIQKNIIAFSHLESVKSMKYLANQMLLSEQLSVVSGFYLNFLKRLRFLPIGAYKYNLNGHYDLDKAETDNRAILETIQKIKENELNCDDMVPIHLRYSDKSNFHFVAGMVRMQDRLSGDFHLVDLFLPKELINGTPGNLSYVREILDSYTIEMAHKKHGNSRGSIVEYVTSQGYYYNKFLQDCKLYFGDTFYSFTLKRRMIEAANDIVFSEKSLKVIAFKNGFDGYKTMYKAFDRYQIPLPDIPRLVYLS